MTHGDGPLLIVAGAGTGKTEVITRRIAWLVTTRRALPSEILGLTFTDKAAAEMQLRVDQLVPYGFADTAISTFHAFGDRLIREFAYEVGLSPDARVLSRAETVVFLREHLFELGLQRYLPLGDPTRFLGALASLFGRCRDEDIGPARYAEFAAGLVAAEEAGPGGTGEEIDDDDVTARREFAARQAELASAYGRYTELLGSTGSIDFGDQVAMALRLLRESAAIRRTVQARYRYVLVDEFQDTNPAQSALVSILAERHRNITVVGDDDQSIYRFRGAAISNILEFRDRHRGARTVVLRRNYRSTAPILDAAHRLIRFNDPDRLESRFGISKQLVPQRPAASAAPVRHLSFATGTEESDWIAAEFRRRIDAGIHPRDLAVLIRANADADTILRSFNVAGVPWRFAGHLRAVRPAGGPVAPVRPPRGLGSRCQRRRLCARRVGGLCRSGRRPLDGDVGARVARIDRRGRSSTISMRGVRGLRSRRPAGRPSPASPAICDASATWPTHARRGRCSTPSSATPAGSRRWPRPGRRPPRRRSPNVARFFDIVRARSALLVGRSRRLPRAAPRNAHRGRRRSGVGGSGSRISTPCPS